MPGPSDSAAAKPAGGQGKPDKVESEAGGELDEFAPAEHLEDGSLAVLAFDLDNPGPDMYRTVTILESLGSPPGDCTLGLRGMKFVNAQLEGKGHRLAADWQGAEKGLAVLLEISGTSAEFGRFWFAGNALQFRWSKRLGDKERATLRWLSACVVEVRSDRTLRRVALCQTYSMESVPLRKEEDRVVVPVDFSAPGLSRGRNPFPAQAFPLRLWRGKVLFEEMEYLFGFGDARGSSPPYVIAGLAEKVGADQVRINMEPGKEAESGVWRLLIRPIVKVPGSKLIGEVEKKQKRLVALTRRLSVVLSPRLGMAQRMEALRQLAEVLEKPAPRTYPRLDPRMLGALNVRSAVMRKRSTCASCCNGIWRLRSRSSHRPRKSRSNSFPTSRRFGIEPKRK